jgi:hypothetical protein
MIALLAKLILLFWLQVFKRGLGSWVHRKVAYVHRRLKFVYMFKEIDFDHSEISFGA